jgi:activator of HSP90 ATPase
MSASTVIVPEIHQEIILNASPKRIYEILMDSKQHAEFTANGDAEISKEAGGAFFCHGGNVAGRNIELIPDRRIVQAWRVKNWPEGIYSIVKFELEPHGHQTRLVLDHTAVPVEHRDHTDQGWHIRYWEPLKSYLSK